MSNIQYWSVGVVNADRTSTPMSYQPVSQFSYVRGFNRSLLGAMAITGLSMVLSGTPLPFSVDKQALVVGAAQAQDSNISSEDITSYAASVLEMDPYRTQAYNQIKNLLSGIDHDMSAVDMSCAGTANLNQLPRNIRSDVRAIVVDYCERANDIVEQNGLSVTQFNTITARYPQDPGLAEQIRTALIQIQQRSVQESEPAPAE
jgi:hypothetical protein